MSLMCISISYTEKPLKDKKLAGPKMFFNGEPRASVIDLHSFLIMFITSQLR